MPSLRLAVHVATYYEWLNSANWNEIKSAGFVRGGASWIANRWQNAETRRGLVDVLRSA
jgi:hypothetical protein